MDRITVVTGFGTGQDIKLQFEVGLISWLVLKLITIVAQFA